MFSQIVGGIFDGRAFWMFSKPQYWMHPVQVLVCGALLIRWWHHYEWRPPQRVLFTVVIGLLALWLWVSPLAYIGENFFGLDKRKPGFDPAYFGADGLPYYLNLGIRFFRMILRPILGKEVRDPTSGFVGVNRSALQVFSKSFPLEYPEIEALVVLQRKAFRFTEEPCRFHPRRTGKSSITPMKSFYYIVHVLLGVFVNVLRLPRLR